MPYSPPRWHRLLAAVLALAAAAPARAADAQDPAPLAGEAVVRVSAARSELTVWERSSKVLEFRNRITQVDGFNDEIVEPQPVSPHRLRVLGLKPGVTTMSVIDERNEAWSVEVFVVGDARELQGYLRRLFPSSAVEVVKLGNSVVLRGWVAEPEQIPEIVEVAGQFFAPENVLNQMRVGGGQQVKLKVRVMEVQRTLIRRLGVDLLYAGRDVVLASTPGGVAETLAASFIGDNHLLDVFVEALREERLLKILAEPHLTTYNGRPAQMLAGGEFPIVVPQALGLATIEWREFGVRMEVRPIILGGGRVRLELQPEVSERDFANAVTLQGTTVPGLTSRRVNSEVEMKFGQTLMLAGLLSMRNTAETRKIPFLGELPLIGAAFRRVQYDEIETELVIMVTPELVAPLEPGQIPPGGPGLFTDTPTDRELFIKGMIEVPFYGDRCHDCPPGAFVPPLPSGSLSPAPLHQGPWPGGAPAPGVESAPFEIEPPLIPPEPYDGGHEARRTRGLDPFEGVPAAPVKSGSGRNGGPGLIQPKSTMIAPQ